MFYGSFELLSRLPRGLRARVLRVAWSGDEPQQTPYIERPVRSRYARSQREKSGATCERSGASGNSLAGVRGGS
jgi:hypothetical protein